MEAYCQLVQGGLLQKEWCRPYLTIGTMKDDYTSVRRGRLVLQYMYSKYTVVQYVSKEVMNTIGTAVSFNLGVFPHKSKVGMDRPYLSAAGAKYIRGFIATNRLQRSRPT